MRLISIFFIIIVSSCVNNNVLIKYSVISDYDFEILYSDNLKAEGFEYWSENRYENEAFIYVIGNDLDVRVMYIGKRGLTLYNRTVGEGPILIQGKIHDL